MRVFSTHIAMMDSTLVRMFPLGRHFDRPRLGIACLIFMLVALTTSSCQKAALPPEGQVLVYLDTNAPVVAARSDKDPVALFDKVLVELVPPGERTACHECRREFVVDGDKMRGRTFSFGFVPPPRVLGYRLRLVLFRSAGGFAARRESSIELVGYLPAVAEEGIREITATFRVEDVGTVRGSLERPIVFEDGPPASSLEGSWPGAAVLPCSRSVPNHTVCVPGGAFVMGDPRVTIEGTQVGGQRERIAVVSPFYVDAHEVTVGEVRASKVAVVDSRGRATDPVDDMRDAFAGHCDYTTAPGANEDLPVVCVSANVAQRYCQTRGGDLPTEAEFEVIASLRGTSLTPWGSGDPACAEAVVARDSLCSHEDRPAIGVRTLPERAASGTLDRVVLAAGSIFDLGANVAEWTRDAFQRDDGSCWTSSLVFNPRCEDGATYRSVKGGTFEDLPVDFAQTRRAVDAAEKSATIGFRCVYP